MEAFHKRMAAEITERINSHLAHRAIIDPFEIAFSICNEHKEALPDSESGTFWYWNGFRNVRDMVVRKMNDLKMKDEEAAPAQLPFPGFEAQHLQWGYQVRRDGREMNVPIEQLTDGELAGKAEEYRKMGQACYAHAAELDRFIEWRKQNAPTAADVTQR